MPLPFILGGIALVAGLGGATAGVNGAIKMSDANSKLKRAENMYERNKEKTMKTNARVRKYLDTMGTKQLEMINNFRYFADLLEKIQNRPNMKDINLKHDNIKKLDLGKLKEEGIRAQLLLGSVGGLATGTLGGLAAAGATTTAVMALGTASTGTVISSLSGAAATNAMLAALGGGSIAAGGGGIALGTAILGGATLGVGLLIGGAIFNFAGDKAVENADEVYEKAYEFEKKCEKTCEFLQKLETSAIKYMNTFNTLNEIYSDNFHKIQGLVDEGIVDFNDFRSFEKKSLQILINSVVLLREALKIKLVLDFKKELLNPDVDNQVNQIINNTNELVAV